MGYRRRIYFTDSRKAEIWDRWQRGESMSSIRRRFDLSLAVPDGWYPAAGAHKVASSGLIETRVVRATGKSKKCVRS